MVGLKRNKTVNTIKDSLRLGRTMVGLKHFALEFL